MNKLLISALAVPAVTLLSGCQHVTVRHHHPEPVEVVETNRTVYVEHRDVEVHEHHREHRPSQRIVVRTNQRNEERRHDHRPPRHTEVTPAPPLRVIESHTTGRIVTPGQRHEKPGRRFEVVNLPKHQTAPGRRDEERGHRRSEHTQPPRHVPARMQRDAIPVRHRKERNSRQPRHVNDKGETQRPEHYLPMKRTAAPERQYKAKEQHRQPHEHRIEKRESHHSGNTRPQIRKTRQGATATQQTSITAKPESHSNKSHKEDKRWKRDHHDKRNERRHGG